MRLKNFVLAKKQNPLFCFSSFLIYTQTIHNNLDLNKLKFCFFKSKNSILKKYQKTSKILPFLLKSNTTVICFNNFYFFLKNLYLFIEQKNLFCLGIQNKKNFYNLNFFIYFFSKYKKQFKNDLLFFQYLNIFLSLNIQIFYFYFYFLRFFFCFLNFNIFFLLNANNKSIFKKNS